MAKKKNDLTKAERIQHLLDLFKIHHYMDKSGVDSALAAITGAPVSDLKQSTYRDLKWLVDKGRLCVRHQMADGTVVQDGEQGSRKPHKSDWYLPNTDIQFIGSGLISKVGAALCFSHRLEGKFRVIDANAGQVQNPNSINIESSFGKERLCLSIDIEARPWILLIGRLRDEDLKKQNNFIAKVEDICGLRCLFLHVPVREISAFRDKTQAGQCCIEYLESKDVVVTHLSSTNPTLFDPNIIPHMVDEDRLDRQYHIFAEKTADMKNNPFDQRPLIIKPARHDGFLIKMPFEIECASRVRFLVYET